MTRHDSDAVRRRETVYWAITALIFLASGLVAFWFAGNLQPAAGMENLARYLTVPGAALVVIGAVLLVATGGMAKTSVWATPLLRVMSYLLLALFFGGCMFMVVVWARRWTSEGITLGAEDLIAAVVFVLTLVVGVRGLRATRTLSSQDRKH